MKTPYPGCFLKLLPAVKVLRPIFRLCFLFQVPQRPCVHHLSKSCKRIKASGSNTPRQERKHPKHSFRRRKQAPAKDIPCAYIHNVSFTTAQATRSTRFSHAHLPERHFHSDHWLRGCPAQRSTLTGLQTVPGWREHGQVCSRTRPGRMNHLLRLKHLRRRGTHSLQAMHLPCIRAHELNRNCRTPISSNCSLRTTVSCKSLVLGPHAVCNHPKESVGKQAFPHTNVSFILLSSRLLPRPYQSSPWVGYPRTSPTEATHSLRASRRCRQSSDQSAVQEEDTHSACSGPASGAT